MLTKSLFFTSLLLISNTIITYGQVDCGNIGFETGTTLGWTLSNGIVTNIGTTVSYQSEKNGSSAGGFALISGGNDPNITTEAIPMVAPGSNYSIRLGKTILKAGGGTFDRIKTSFVVTADNSLFQYKFAVVLQNSTTSGGGNGGAVHQSYEKPGFNLQIFDKNGNKLDCSYYDIQLLSAANVADGFKAQGDLQYRNWTTGAIDLRKYIGQTLSIVVTAHGCTKKEHCGYAYFDAQCYKAEIKQVSSCPDADGNSILKAPDGFEKYTWSTGETTSSIKVKAVLGKQYSVKVLPYASLNGTCELSFDYTIKLIQVSSSVSKTICAGEEVIIGNKSFKTQGIFTETINNGTCDSTVTLNLTVLPIKTYAQKLTICAGESVAVGNDILTMTGIYTTHINKSSLCDSIVTTDLTVENSFKITINPTITTVSRGDSVLLQATVEPADNYIYAWTPTASLSCATCSATWAKPSTSTTYTLLVTTAGKKCPKTAESTINVSCGVFTPNAFTPNSDQTNDIFFVNASDCVKQIKEMLIFDRWGDVVYAKENFQASDPTYGWNGFYLGKIAEIGTYPYKMQVEFKDGTINEYRGTVTLLR